MTDHRKRYDNTFKAKVVLESFKNEKTIAELASDYGVHPNQITQWRKQALEDLPTLFSPNRAKKDKAHEEEKEELLRQIGQLKMEVERLTKSPGFFTPRERELIDMSSKIIVTAHII
jgi:transposase-like protein